MYNERRKYDDHPRTIPYIYSVKRLENRINDKCRVKYNAIFDTVIHRNSHRGHLPP